MSFRRRLDTVTGGPGFVLRQACASWSAHASHRGSSQWVWPRCGGSQVLLRYLNHTHTSEDPSHSGRTNKLGPPVLWQPGPLPLPEQHGRRPCPHWTTSLLMRQRRGPRRQSRRTWHRSRDSFSQAGVLLGPLRVLGPALYLPPKKTKPYTPPQQKKNLIDDSFKNEALYPTPTKNKRT